MSSTAMSEMLTLGQQYQEVFVKPMVDAVVSEVRTQLTEFRKEITAVEDKVKAHDVAITGLQSNQKKALVGWGVLSVGVASALTAGWTWFKSHFKIGLS